MTIVPARKTLFVMRCFLPWTKAWAVAFVDDLDRLQPYMLPFKSFAVAAAAAQWAAVEGDPAPDLETSLADALRASLAE